MLRAAAGLAGGRTTGYAGVKISVITVCRNSARTIADTLRSVAAQTHVEVEHIIVDGASTDATLDIIRAQGQLLTRVISEPDHGIYDAMNKGIALASGDVIGFLNSDDYFAGPNELEFVVKAFEDPGVDACHADLVYVDEHDSNKVVRYWKSSDYQLGQFKTGWMPAHPTFYVRRSVYQTLGGFDLQFRLQADFELTTRFLEVHRIKSVHIPRVMVTMRTGGATNRSLTNVLKGNLEAYRACLKNGLPVTPLFMLRKVLSRIPQFLARHPDAVDPARRKVTRNV